MLMKQYPNLVKHALQIIYFFESTYCCERFFSKMKLSKGKQRGQLSDKHLKSHLRIACSSTKVNINKVVRDVLQQKSRLCLIIKSD